MEQQSALAQTTQPEESQTRNRFARVRDFFAMHHFFTEDTSPDNGQVVELQRRATWLGLALFLMSVSEVLYDPQPIKAFSYVLYAFVSFLAFALLAMSFAAVWMTFRPMTLKQQTQQAHQSPRRWQRITLKLMLILALVGSYLCIYTVVESFLPPQFTNDGTSLDTNAAALLLQGRNPYTDSNMLDIARRFGIQPNWTTPLRVGEFANRLEYPTPVEFQTVMDTDLKNGDGSEFESKVSYPALSFLTLVPFVWLKSYNVLPFYLACYALLVAIAWKVVRPELRPWVLLLAMANVPMWSSTVSGNLDIFYTLLIVMAWLLRDYRWRSALFLGLAVASKQIAWYFVPFYLIMTWRHYSLEEAVRRLAIAGTIGLAFNLPFILWDPQAWLAGVFAPVADPMFPLGIGLIELSITHVLPYFPGWVYSFLEGGALILALAYYWRLCRKHPEAAMLLAVLPLIFAWRSLPSYFYCAIYPIFLLMAARPLPGSYGARRRTVPFIFGSGERAMRKQGIPASIGARAAMQIVSLCRGVISPGRFASAWSWLFPHSVWPGQEEDEPAVQGG